MSKSVDLSPGQVALVGYGSLLSIRSLERTLGRTYTGPFLSCTVAGWRRTWDAAMPNRTFFTESPEGRIYPETILYLNVQRDPGTILNASLFVVDPPELARFDERESIYERVDVTDSLDLSVEGGRAYLYSCLPEHVRSKVASTKEGAVRATYVAIVEEGLAGLGLHFREQYEHSTEPVPAGLVIDDRT